RCCRRCSVRSSASSPAAWSSQASSSRAACCRDARRWPDMRVHILSDLHLSMAPFAAPATDADVVVLAGDITRPDGAMAFASALGKPVVYVAGNHEFYGGSLDGTVARLKELAHGTQVRVLEQDAVVIGGVRFLGTTL